jgi:hypothetical protein
VTTATFEPKKIVVTATSHWPFGDWAVERTVRILANDPQSVKDAAKTPGGTLVSGGGNQADATLKDFKLGDRQLTATLRIDDVSAGEYAGAVSLDPLVEKAASQEITLKARHGFEWPLIVLVFGMLGGVGGTWAYDRRRRRDVLRIALVDAATWLQFVPATAGVYDLQGKLVGTDPNVNLFPSANECRKSKPTLGVPRLYCQIRSAFGTQSLDARTKNVQEMLAQIDRWFRAGQAATALRAAIARLDDPDLASARTDSLLVAETLAAEPEADQAELTLAGVKAQAEVIKELADTWRLYEAAGRPADCSPLDVYKAAPSGIERTPEESRALALRLRVLGARISPPRLTREFALEAAVGAPGWSLATDQTTPVEAEAQAAEPPWASDEGGGYHLSQHIRRNVRLWDLFLFLAHASVAAIAFLLPVWLATAFGSFDQYVAVFAAGFLGKVALDQTLSPFRSIAITPAAQAASPGEAAAAKAQPTAADA